MTKFCPKCGNELSDDAEFCGKCGTNLKIINNMLNEDSDSFNEKSKEKSKDENKSKINIKTIDKKIIAIVIVGIALVGIGLMFVLGDGHQDNYQIKVTDASLSGTIGASYGDTFSYDLYGSIIPMPKNSTDISIQTDYYDSNGTLVESNVRTMPEIYPSDNSNSVVLGSYYSNHYVNMDHANIQIVDNGKVVSNITYKFNMKDMQVYDENFTVVENYNPEE